MRHHIVVFFLLVFIFFVPLSSSAIGNKRLAKQIAKDSIRSKLVIDNTATGRSFPSASGLFYNTNTQEFTITGKLLKVPVRANRRDLKIFINGRDVIGGKTVGSFKLSKPKKRSSKYYGRGTFSAVFGIPVIPEWPILDISVELVHLKSDQVIARDKVSLYDLRYEQNANPNASVQTRPKGMAVQLTDTGLGGTGNLSSDAAEGLEIPLLDSLPFPSLQSFNQKLTMTAQNLPERKIEELSKCIDFADLTEDRFKSITQFGPYATVFSEAVANKQLYDFLSANQGQCLAYFGPLGLGCPAGLAAWCVKSNPGANDFRLCVNTVKEKPSGLKIPGIEDVDLNFLQSPAGSGAIEAQVDFGGYDGEVDGYLRDLSIEWKTSNCILPPKADVPNELIIEPGKEWLDNWTYCPDLIASSNKATTRNSPSNSGKYSIQVDRNNPHALAVREMRALDFDYSNLSTYSQVGSCALNFINSSVENLLDQFQPQFQSIIDSSWQENTPDTPTASALELILDPLNLGDAVEPNHDLSARIQNIKSLPVSGLKVEYENAVQPIDSGALKLLNNSYYTQGAGAPFDGSLGLDPDDSAFDLSYDVTIGLLNSILFVRGATDELNFQYVPTDSELQQHGISSTRKTPSTRMIGGGLPGGGLPEPLGPLLLTGTRLAGLHEAFDEIGDRTLEIYVERTLDPITYMATDPVISLASSNGIRVAFGLNALKVTFKEPDVLANNGAIAKTGKVWAVFEGGFIDSDFSLSHDSIAGSKTLIPNWGTPVYYLTLEDSKLKKCPKFTHDITVDQSESCERSLELAVASFVKTRLEPLATTMLSSIPAPQFFAVEGAGEVAVQSSGQSKLQLNQHINNFSSLRTVAN